MADFGDYGAGRPVWKNEDAANLILFPSRPDGPVMLLSASTLEGMVKPDPLNPVWHRFFLYDQRLENLSPGDYRLNTLFEQDYKLFLIPYRFAEGVAKFIKLLDILNLGDRQALFVSAMRSKRSSVKLTSPASHQELKKNL
ncbi:hypothetical protein ABK905_06385 [Acerihabitans sp. KWT182]|uniref:Uncharacterized protein n=1 Tax=Acerihabitans sp. KWT182 TaxID=3157919 RepID=A0AAU7QBX0_9GAMM